MKTIYCESISYGEIEYLTIMVHIVGRELRLEWAGKVPRTNRVSTFRITPAPRSLIHHSLILTLGRRSKMEMS
jgi:hypothetical protein